MESIISTNTQYHAWLKELKQKILKAQIKAAVSVNTALLEFYWNLGADIVEKQKNAEWGSGFLKQLSHDLRAGFPDMKGFSLRNIKYIRQWHLFYNNEESAKTTQAVSPIGQQAVAQLFQVPWGHNLVIVSKSKTVAEVFFYVHKTIENNWSRSVLTHQIESGLYSRQGKAITNFIKTLPATQSDLAQQIIKDPYNFDFMTLTENYNERELEQGLIQHMQKFTHLCTGCSPWKGLCQKSMGITTLRRVRNATSSWI